MKKSVEGGKKTDINEKAFAMPRKNVYYILIGFAVMVLGYILMSGGGSDNPQEFNNEMFSFRRTVLAPIVILVGMVLEIVAIMYRGKGNK